MEIVITDLLKRSNPYLNRITVVKGDIIRQEVGAIITLLPASLEYRGSLNKAILEGAGTDLDHFVLENIYRPKPGDVYAVPGFNLPCQNIFFCVVPVWRDDMDHHNRYLLTASRRAMEMAAEMQLTTVAFPPIGSGRHGFPKRRASRLILQGISERLDERFEEVRIVARTAQTCTIFEERLQTMLQAASSISSANET